MRGLRFVPAILGVAALSLGAAEPPATSEGYAYATYRGMSERLTLLVDSYPAAMHARDSYIPLAVAIGLSGPGSSVRVTPESFTLLDESGRAYRAVPFEEIARNYPKRQFDASLLRSHPMVVGNQFDTSLAVRGSFYPTLVGRGLRIDQVELGPFTWFHSLLYYPLPDGGLHGVLTLRISGPGLESPVDVRFLVPRVLRERTS
jgi:hypothetical protein